MYFVFFLRRLVLVEERVFCVLDKDCFRDWIVFLYFMMICLIVWVKEFDLLILLLVVFLCSLLVLLILFDLFLWVLVILEMRWVWCWLSVVKFFWVFSSWFWSLILWLLDFLDCLVWFCVFCWGLLFWCLELWICLWRKVIFVLRWLMRVDLFFFLICWMWGLDWIVWVCCVYWMVFRVLLRWNLVGVM